METERDPKEIRPEMARLMEVARENCGCVTWADLGRFINESDQTLTNWKTRGIPADKYLALAKLVRANPYWLESGGDLPKTAYIVADESMYELIHVAEKLPDDYKSHLVKQGKDLATLAGVSLDERDANLVALTRQRTSIHGAPGITPHDVRFSRKRKNPDRDKEDD